jgi:phage I-like protein
MAQQFGYMVDLASLKLDDLSAEDTTLTFQAMPYGEWTHPQYGKINLTPERAARFADNVNNGARGQDLDIDFDHKKYHGEAAGWVRAANAGSDGLYLTVEWTKTALQKIKEKAYRYFSPEFMDEWKHPSTGQVFKDVLFGGGITNRPFLKGIRPLNLSELDAEQEEGRSMDPKVLRKLLGLPEDATDEQVETAQQARLKEIEDNEAKEGEAESADVEKVVAAQLASVGLSEEVIKRLTEGDNADVKALTDAVSTLTRTVAVQGAALQLSETDNIVKTLSEPNEDKVALSTKSQEKLKSVLLKLSEPAARQEITELVQVLTGKGGTVQLGERAGTIEHDSGDGTEAVIKYENAIKKCMEEDKLSYGDAAERVAALHPQLFEAHQQASYSFREL